MLSRAFTRSVMLRRHRAWLQQHGDHVLDAEFLTLEVAQELLVGQGPGDLVANRLLEFGMPDAKRLDPILQGHREPPITHHCYQLVTWEGRTAE